MKKLLLLSNSTNYGEAYLGWPQKHLSEFLSGKKDGLLFIPYAGVGFSWDEYYEKVNTVFSDLGKEIESIHHFQDPIKAIQQAEVIIVGGGNTFQLFRLCQKQGLMAPMRKKVEEGTPYIGWSAGSNLACPTLCTTNDMPIVEPPSFDGLSLIPFQINPHYTEKTIEGHGGESREQRLKEYTALRAESDVVCLPESSLIEVTEEEYRLKGDDAYVLRADQKMLWKEGETRVF